MGITATEVLKRCKSLLGSISRATYVNTSPFHGVFPTFRKIATTKANPCPTVEDTEDPVDPRTPSTNTISKNTSYDNYPLAGVFHVLEVTPPEQRIPSAAKVKAMYKEASIEEVEDEEDPRIPSTHPILEHECYKWFPVAGVFSVFDASTKD